MHGRRALFAPADVQPAGVDLDLVPLQIAKLGSSKPVAVGQQDHGGVPMAIAAVLARGLDQPLDLATGERRFPLSVNYPLPGIFMAVPPPPLKASCCRIVPRIIHSH